MKPTLLVISPVHPPDDPRIRGKLIRSLQDDWDVTFAGIGNGPVNQSGMTWIELTGGRALRGLRAGWLLLRFRCDVASLHDPEMLPVALIASLLGKQIVFDVHENVPAQLRVKPWLPRLLRRPLSWLAGKLLLLAERRLQITLAEDGYAVLFKRQHPVFPNYLAGQPPAPRSPDPEVGVVYLGDVTEARGLALAVEAVAASSAEVMTILGRCSPELERRLAALADAGGLRIKLRGFVAHEDALQLAAAGSLGLSPLLDSPNYANSLPTKVLEYLAVGIPTLASDLPGTRSVVGGKPGVVLVPPGDLASWRAALENALDDDDLRSAAQAGAAAIVDMYVWPTQAVQSFYADLLRP